MKPVKGRGWCSMHLERHRKHGDPLVTLTPARGTGGQRTRPCLVDDCLNPAKARGWCDMHYARWYQHGDPLKRVRNYGAGQRTTTNGYVEIYRPGHPLAMSHGYVLAHRLAIWDAGLDPTGWEVHHVDLDKQNNELSNLELLTPAEHHRRHAEMRSHR